MKNQIASQLEMNRIAEQMNAFFGGDKIQTRITWQAGRWWGLGNVIRRNAHMLGIGVSDFNEHGILMRDGWCTLTGEREQVRKLTAWLARISSESCQ